MSETTGRRLVYWSVAFVVSSALVKAAQAAVFMFIASVLSVVAFSKFGVVYALLSGMSMFSAIGITETTIGRLKEFSSRRQLFSDSTSVFLGTSGIAFLAMVGLTFIVARDNYMAAMFALVLGGFSAFATVQAGLQRIEEQHGQSLMNSAGVPLASIVGLVAGAWFTKDLVYVFGLGALCAGLMTLFMIFSGRVHYCRLPNIHLLRSRLPGIRPFAGITLFGWLSGYGMTLVIATIFQADQVATYAFLFSLSSIGQLLTSAMNMVWGPRFYRLFNDGKQRLVEKQNRNYYSLQSATVAVVSCVVMLSIPPLLNALGGNLVAYADSRLELGMLMLGYVVVTPWWHGQSYYLVTDRGPELLRLNLLAGGAGLLVWIACMYLFGPIGIFIGFAIQMLLKSIIMWTVARREWPLRSYWISVLLASVLVILVATIR